MRNQQEASTGLLYREVHSPGRVLKNAQARDLVAHIVSVRGLVCLGYPFHPIGKPDQLRTAHLAKLKTPALIVQGTRDPFGTRQEVATYTLAKTIEILWLEDGDHDLKPRKRISGFSAADHLRTVGERVAAWATSIAA